MKTILLLFALIISLASCNVSKTSHYNKRKKPTCYRVIKTNPVKSFL